VTTSDQTQGRLAATRLHRGAATLCACLLAALPALPAMAMQPVAQPPRGASAAPAVLAASPVTAPAEAAPTAQPADLHDATVVFDQPMQMSDRALLLATDINRLMGAGKGEAPKAAESAGGGRIQNVLQRALALLGTPYRWGGTSTDGFDCSGLVGYVFRTIGIDLPRVSRDMAHSGQEVDRDSLVPGDLVFFGKRGRVDHVGIYLGENRFVHAPRTGRDVTVSSLDGYWGHKFVEARRVAGI
jgi:cell wall-associated NlpC family hydrolase